MVPDEALAISLGHWRTPGTLVAAQDTQICMALREAQPSYTNMVLGVSPSTTCFCVPLGGN